MLAWEKVLVEKGYKNLPPGQQRAIKELLGQAWRHELEKARKEREFKQGRKSADADLYYRDPSARNIYRPVNSAQFEEKQDKHSHDEMREFRDMLEKFKNERIMNASNANIQSAGLESNKA